MSFYGATMVFDGIASEEMGLALYDFSSKKQDATSFAADLSASEDRIAGRYRSLFYGGTVNSALKYTMVLCAVEERAYRNEPFDRWDLQKISSWLTGHDSYKWLTILQPDMAMLRYRCLISNLQAVEVAGNKWGFSCTVTCDSPFAYMPPKDYVYQVTSMLTDCLFSDSTHNGFYYPQLHINDIAGGNIEIQIDNEQESSVFRLLNLPSAIGDLSIDCENGVLSASSGVNPYQYIDFTEDFHFPRLVRGDNIITLTGSGFYIFTCEWPVNVGS